MNHKRKKHKPEKSIEWKTPRVIQMEGERELPNRRGGKRKRCKKTKGAHIFMEVKRDEFKWMWSDKKEWLVEYRCACGKKKIGFY